MNDSHQCKMGLEVYSTSDLVKKKNLSGQEYPIQKKGCYSRMRVIILDSLLFWRHRIQPGDHSMMLETVSVFY